MVELLVILIVALGGYLAVTEVKTAKKLRELRVPEDIVRASTAKWAIKLDKKLNEKDLYKKLKID